MTRTARAPRRSAREAVRHGASFAASFAAALVALLAAVHAAAAPIDAMVAFDGRFIPALASTSAASGDPAAAARARDATARLVAEWPGLRERLAAAGATAPAAARWPGMLAQIDRRIAQADALVRDGRHADAHEALEAVRPAMLEARRAAGIDYLVDRLVEYHEPMEALVAGAAGGLDAAGLAAMVRTFAHARALWHAIERTPVDAERHALSPRRLEQFRRGVADETAALARLSEALRAGDPAAVAAAAVAVKPPFARAYTAFGLPPDEAPARRP